MPIHLSRRRLIAGGLAGAGLAAVPVFGASDVFATAVCVVPPEAGMWANDLPTATETISRLRLRYDCPRGPKGRGRWFVSAWHLRNRGAPSAVEYPWGEVEVRYDASGVGSRLLEAEWPARGSLPLRRLRALVQMHHVHHRITGSWFIQKVPGGAFRWFGVTFHRPSGYTDY